MMTMMMFLLSYVSFEYTIWWWSERPSLTLVWTFFYFSECSQSLLWQMIKTSKKVSRSETKLTTWERSEAFLTTWERSEMLFVTFAELSATHAIDMCSHQQNGQSQLVEKTLLEKILKKMSMEIETAEIYKGWRVSPQQNIYLSKDFIQKVTLAWEPH